MTQHRLIYPLVLLALASLAPRPVRAQTPEVFSVRAGSSVRVSAAGEVKSLRLEVFARRGEKFFDSQAVPGASLDWPLVDAAGAPLADGTYYYTLTLTYASGFTLRHLGRVALRWDRALLRPQFVERLGPTGDLLAQDALAEQEGPASATSGGLFQLDVSDSRNGDGLPLLSFRNPLPSPAFTSAGGRAIVARGAGANQGGGALVAQFGNAAVLDETRQAILAHDGTDARLARRGGALRVMTGDLFSGADVERRRGMWASAPPARRRGWRWPGRCGRRW